MVRLGQRSYLSSQLLWVAEDEARRAAEIEEGWVDDGSGSAFSIRHRGSVLSSIVMSAMFLEATVNELYQDAHDDYTHEDAYVTPLDERTRRMMKEAWATTQGRGLTTLDKYQLILACAGGAPLDRGAQPFQDAQLVVQLRNVLVHYQPEIIFVDDTHRLEEKLRGKFPENSLMARSGNPWWPSKCLGAGAAMWAARSACAFADRVMADLGLRPNYQRMRENSWRAFGG